MKLEGQSTGYRLIGGPFDGDTCKGETLFVVKPIPRDEKFEQRFAIYRQKVERIDILNKDDIVGFEFVETCFESEIEEVMERLDPGDDEQEEEKGE